MRQTSEVISRDEAEEREFQELCKSLHVQVRPLVRADGSLDPEIFWPLKKPELQAPYLSDDHLSLMFCMNYGNKLRYVVDEHQWIMWDGGHWMRDDLDAVFIKVREFCRRLADEIDDPKLGKQICSRYTIDTVEALSRKDHRISTRAADLDTDNWVLATHQGTVDLKTGQLRPAKRIELCTKITSVAPGRGCPLWLDFLNLVTHGDGELQAYLQRVAGYILTGDIREHAVFFLYGFGGNGKTTFIETIRNILGDYATTVPLRALESKKGDQIPADIAKLKGARLAVSTETERGKSFDDAKLKWLTGGDKLSARYLYRNFFDFEPQFKLVISGNHKPAIHIVDDGIRRRLHLIPFKIKIANPDKSFPEKLRSEWRGILQWMIDGCMEWQQRGLDAPDSVRAETEDYLAEQDVIRQWIEERCLVGKTHSAGSTELYNDWKAWCEVRSEIPGAHRDFIQTLSALGYTRGKAGCESKRVIRGLSLRHLDAQQNAIKPSGHADTTDT